MWERASGLKADPAAFAWWELFASVKGQAIWISSAKEYRDGGYMEPVLGFLGLGHRASPRRDPGPAKLAEAGRHDPERDRK